MTSLDLDADLRVSKAEALASVSVWEHYVFFPYLDNAPSGVEGAKDFDGRRVHVPNIQHTLVFLVKDNKGVSVGPLLTKIV
jgi:hypothetical protein